MEFVFVLVAVAVVGTLAYGYWHRKRTKEAFAALLARDGLQRTTSPCGLHSTTLRSLRACPRGDRRCGLEYAVTGHRAVAVAGDSAEVECAAFVWWWEERQTSTDSKGHTTTRYVKRRRVVGALRLPLAVPAVSIAPEGMFARLGLGGRSDFQVESEEFNRRFDVRVQPGAESLAIRLLDARFQAFLLEMFQGRWIEFVGDVVLVGGDPPGRDGNLFGDVAELPGARRDVALLVDRVPDSFWRGSAPTSSPVQP